VLAAFADLVFGDREPLVRVSAGATVARSAARARRSRRSPTRLLGHGIAGQAVVSPGVSAERGALPSIRQMQ
jgi:hypothetical protein